MSDEKKDKPKKLIVDGVQKDKHYVQAHSEGRGRSAELVVKVWYNKTTPTGEPDGDWGMPGMIPVQAAVDQAILNTQGDVEAKAKGQKGPKGEAAIDADEEAKTKLGADGRPRQM